MKKIISLLLTISVCFSLLVGCGNNTDVEESSTNLEPIAVNVAVLKGPTAMGMVKLMSDSDADNTGENNYTITISAAIDEITPKIVQGEVDIAAIPANMASVLYNNNADVSVLAINTLGVMYILENGDSIQSVEDLRGKTIYASGKGATPEYALNYMLESNGIDPITDVTIEYKAEHTECLTALVSNENAIAMLPQPFATTALMKSGSTRIALDITKEWEKKQGEDSTLITGVVVVRNNFLKEKPEAVKTFMAQYKASVEYVNKNIDDAAVLIGNYDIVTAEVAKEALPYCNITFIEGDEMKTKLSGYLEILLDQNPKSIGGALPNADFYYKQ